MIRAVDFVADDSVCRGQDSLVLGGACAHVPLLQEVHEVNQKKQHVREENHVNEPQKNSCKADWQSAQNISVAHCGTEAAVGTEGMHLVSARSLRLDHRLPPHTLLHSDSNFQNSVTLAIRGDMNHGVDRPGVGQEASVLTTAQMSALAFSHQNDPCSSHQATNNSAEDVMHIRSSALEVAGKSVARNEASLHSSGNIIGAGSHADNARPDDAVPHEPEPNQVNRKLSGREDQNAVQTASPVQKPVILERTVQNPGTDENTFAGISPDHQRDEKASFQTVLEKSTDPEQNFVSDTRHGIVSAVQTTKSTADPVPRAIGDSIILQTVQNCTSSCQADPTVPVASFGQGESAQCLTSAKDDGQARHAAVVRTSISPSRSNIHASGSAHQLEAHHAGCDMDAGRAPKICPPKGVVSHRRTAPDHTLDHPPSSIRRSHILRELSNQHGEPVSATRRSASVDSYAEDLAFDPPDRRLDSSAEFIGPGPVMGMPHLAKIPGSDVQASLMCLRERAAHLSAPNGDDVNSSKRHAVEAHQKAAGACGSQPICCDSQNPESEDEAPLEPQPPSIQVSAVPAGRTAKQLQGRVPPDHKHAADTKRPSLSDRSKHYDVPPCTGQPLGQQAAIVSYAGQEFRGSVDQPHGPHPLQHIHPFVPAKRQTSCHTDQVIPQNMIYFESSRCQHTQVGTILDRSISDLHKQPASNVVLAQTGLCGPQATNAIAQSRSLRKRNYHSFQMHESALRRTDFSSAPRTHEPCSEHVEGIFPPEVCYQDVLLSLCCNMQLFAFFANTTESASFMHSIL